MVCSKWIVGEGFQLSGKFRKLKRGKQWKVEFVGS